MRNVFYPKFPNVEKGVLFIQTDNKPFFAAQVGITNPCPDYEIQYNKPAPKNMTILEHVLEGEVDILINGLWEKAVAGDTYILTGGTRHHYKTNPANPCKKIFVNYYSEYLHNFLAAYKITDGIYKADTKNLFFTLLYLLDNYISDAEDSLTISNSVNSIIVALSFHHKNHNNNISLDIKSKLDSLLQSKINLDKIAFDLGISKSTLIRSFKKEFNSTPYNYVLTQKIYYAKYLLDTTDLRINEIAEKVYIIDEHHFSLMFKKLIGISPANYKKQK